MIGTRARLRGIFRLLALTTTDCCCYSDISRGMQFVGSPANTISTHRPAITIEDVPASRPSHSDEQDLVDWTLHQDQRP